MVTLANGKEYFAWFIAELVYAGYSSAENRVMFICMLQPGNEVQEKARAAREFVKNAVLPSSI